MGEGRGLWVQRSTLHCAPHSVELSRREHKLPPNAPKPGEPRSGDMATVFGDNTVTLGSRWRVGCRHRASERRGRRRRRRRRRRSSRRSRRRGEEREEGGERAEEQAAKDEQGVVPAFATALCDVRCCPLSTLCCQGQNKRGDHKGVNLNHAVSNLHQCRTSHSTRAGECRGTRGGRGGAGRGGGAVRRCWHSRRTHCHLWRQCCHL